MGVNSGIYKFLLVLHIAGLIYGFGPVVLNGLYGAKAKRQGGREGVAISTANFEVTKVAEYVIYAVPIIGFGLVGTSDKVWKMSQTWLWLALLLYLVGIGISHAVLIPSHRRMNVITAEMAAMAPGSTQGPPPQAAEADALSQKLAAAGGALNVLLVIIIFLMVWKPGV